MIGVGIIPYYIVEKISCFIRLPYYQKNKDTIIYKILLFN